MSLKKELEQIDDRLGIGNRHTVESGDLYQYIQTQVNEMKAVLTRIRVDILLNEQIPVDGKAETEGRDKKIKELTNDAEQFVSSINVLTQLLKDLA
jgi:hypothetical protein